VEALLEKPRAIAQASVPATVDHLVEGSMALPVRRSSSESLAEALDQPRGGSVT
jgi:hypothetical protein